MNRRRLLQVLSPQWQSVLAALMFVLRAHAFSFTPPTRLPLLAHTASLSRISIQTSITTVAFVRRHTLPPLWAMSDDDIEEEDVMEEEYNEEDDEEEYEEEEEWDEDGEEDLQDYELEDDLSDPNYMRQKELVDASIKAREQLKQDQDFDALDYIMEKMSSEQAEMMEELPTSKEIQAMTESMLLTEEDFLGVNLDQEVTDLMDDPYPSFEEEEENLLEKDIGITNQEMINLQDAWKTTQDAQVLEPWDRVMAKDENPEAWARLSNETLTEMDACLEEIGGSAYNVTRWLLYDLDFNVTNLMLAAVKHNRRAPILFQHWYPQLVTYSRYKSASDANFDFSWVDVEQADISELERYYKGMGYDEIPSKAPGETGIISLEDLDEEEIRMAAFENWMADVYNPEWDRFDFDNDEMRDEDNVFSPYYEAPQHPDFPTYEDAQEDLEDWDDEMGDDDEDREHKQYMGRDYKYKIVEDAEFQEQFRGHLVVACTADDDDLEVAEKITARMSSEFGKQVFVETRVIAHARKEEDNVFEVWLESYEIDLLHSKKRASLNAKGWDGPAECDDEQIEYLAKKVGFLISDESRYSYRFESENAE